MAFPYGSVKFLPGTTRTMVVISKKTCPKAVGRNRLRRRIRAIVHECGASERGVAVYPNKKALSATFAELKQALAQVLR